MKKILTLIAVSSVVILWWCLQQKTEEKTTDTMWWMELSAEHCAMMPDMAGCEKINLSGWIITWSQDNSMMWHTMNHADMVSSEFDFIYLMIPHHQEAVDTAKSLNSITQNAELKTLTQNIINGQSQEISMMKWWLQKFYPDTVYEGMWYMPMMRDTSSISAITTIEKMWIEDMIGHHQWAVDMANKVLTLMKQQDPLIKLSAEGNAHREEVRTFAQAVIDAQTKEITQMEMMLQSY